MRIDAGGIEWYANVAGPADGPTVLLLHGFPEDHRSWDRQMEPLAAARFRAVAADLPGYGGTDEPTRYDVRTLGGLVGALAAELGGAHVVGHDWGGILTCAAAYLRPDAIRSTTVVCAAHPGAFSAALRIPRQLMKSWYVGAFQLPAVEWLFGAGSGAIARTVLPRVAPSLNDPARLRRALAYYRVNLNPFRLGNHGIGRVAVPGVYIHARRDRYITEEIARRSAALFDDLRDFVVIDAGHFVQRDQAAELNRRLIDFLRSLS